MTEVHTRPATARVATTPLEHRVWDALGSVMDPELDEPVTTLGFVEDWSVEDGVARVRLRLPTYFCAPNFVWMMVADAHDALSAVEGVVRVDVGVHDHFATSEIALTSDLTPNDRLGAAAPTPTCRTSKSSGSPSGARRTPRHSIACGANCVATAPSSRTSATVALPTFRRATTATGSCGAACRSGCRPSRPRCCCWTKPGQPISTADAELWLRRAQTVRVNIEGNAELCRGLLCSRYELGEHQAQIATPLSITPRVRT